MDLHLSPGGSFPRGEDGPVVRLTGRKTFCLMEAKFMFELQDRAKTDERTENVPVTREDGVSGGDEDGRARAHPFDL